MAMKEIKTIEINPLELSKDFIKQKANQVIEQVKEGNLGGDVAMFYSAAYKQFSEIISKDKNVREDALKEVSNGKTDYFGNKLSSKNNNSYDYSNSPAWVKQNEKVKELHDTYLKDEIELLKNIEDHARKAKKSSGLYDPETGENLGEIHPAICKSETIPVIKIKQE